MACNYYIGIMSGTSLDGIDAVLVDFKSQPPSIHKTFFLSFDAAFKSKLLALHDAGHDELNKAALVSIQLAQLYAQVVNTLLTDCVITPQDVIAIGCHGQTVRHCPESDKRYSIQLVNAALLAELTGITVVTDFRSRDLAAGGQGAPLVPAFHKAMFMDSSHHRVIVNIGGIANLTSLDPENTISGFDCGPGNILMDAWCLQHIDQPFDNNGQWSATGQIIPALLEKFLSTDFFSYPPPKSTGRELFNIEWLESQLQGNESPEDVQATLLQLTVQSIARSIQKYYPTSTEIYLCGGGAHNFQLIQHLKKILSDKSVSITDELGIAVDWVEAFAFAWLARQTMLRQPGNIASVTGAYGERILGAIYPT